MLTMSRTYLDHTADDLREIFSAESAVSSTFKSARSASYQNLLNTV